MHATKWRIGLVLAGCLSLAAATSGCGDSGAKAAKDESSSKEKKKKKKKKKKKRDDDEEEESDGAEQEAPAPAPPKPAPPDAMVQAFFKSQIAACNAYQVKVGNVAAGESYFDGSTDDPSRSLTVVKDLGAQRYLTQDAEGQRLIIDLPKKQITGPSGPTGAMPRAYSFCPHEVWVGTMDEGHIEPEPAPVPIPVPAPPPVAPAPQPGALGPDGLPLVIPSGHSKVPGLDEWNAVPREITVRHSTSLGCETKMLREWLRVSCRGRGQLGVPISVSINRQQGQQAYKLATPGALTSLVAQVVRGKTLEASFVWENGGAHRSATLLVSWPHGAPKPLITFRFP